MSYIEEIEVAELQQQLAAGGENIQLIDIRRRAEMLRGMIPGADRLPLHLIPENRNQLARDRMLVLYCEVGAHSARACSYLANNGFDNVVSLRGGIQAWANSGLLVA